MYCRRFIVFFSLCLLGGGTVSARSIDELRVRMRERVSDIAEAKEAHLIGENRAGYLDIVNPPEDVAERNELQALVGAENADRGEIYRIIAEMVDASVDEVGRQRALRIYRNSAPEVLFETQDGRWRTKREIERR